MEPQSNIDNIITNQEILHRVSASVSEAEISYVVNELYPHMVSTLHNVGGIGLAAPQIGVEKRVFIFSENDTRPTLCINPKIVHHMPFYKESCGEECLSIPGWRFTVNRYRIIRVQYQNEMGEMVERDLADSLARVFQHEFDHLEGKLISDIGELEVAENL